MKRLMPFLIIFVLLVSLSAGCSHFEKLADDRESLKEIAQNYVDAVFDLDYKELAGFEFTLQMKLAMITRASYKAVRDLFVEACGEYIRIVDFTESEKSGYHIVSVICEFENTYANINVVFDDKNRIAGLHYTYNRVYGRNDMNETEVSFGGELPLPGTLAMPGANGNVPAVIIIHGSGPSERNGAIGGNAVYYDIAKQLYDKGIASLRYDKRTYAYGYLDDENYFDNITVWEETINDAIKAFEFLARQDGIDRNRIYFAGHSLGGYLMPRIAGSVPEAAGFIMLAPNASRLEDIIVRQTEYINGIDGKTTSIENKTLKEYIEMRDRIKSLQPDSGYSSEELFWAPESYWLDLAYYFPIDEMQKETRPVLLIHGGRDYQVDINEYNMWTDGLGDKKNIKFILLPELNHLFAAGEGPSTPQEYQKLAEVDLRVGNVIAKFIFD